MYDMLGRKSGSVDVSGSSRRVHIPASTAGYMDFSTGGTGLDGYYQDVTPPDVHQGIIERTLYTLSTPSIFTRCVELTKLLRTAHTLELREVYPTLLQHAFGWETTPGWRLRALKREFSLMESEEVVKFLRPEGPLLELTYRLMGDPNLHYDFPVHAIPVGLQHKLGTPDVSTYVSSKIKDINYRDPTSGYTLVLNPFELFFFHYAYSETRQTLDATSSTLGVGLSNITDSIYSDLLEEYLNYFVPISDNKKVPNPLPSNVFYGTQKPGYMIVPPSKQNNNFEGRSSQQLKDDFNADPPTIFKASVFQAETAYLEQPNFSSQRNPTMESEFWRTEAFLNILISMWLTVDEDDGGYKFGAVLPTVELVKSVRMIVRHWHLFSNVVNRTVNHPMEELRRNIFPLLQKRLYHFIRHLFPRWPLDASFRIVYETWLSYIQPWRYSQSGPQRTGHDPSGADALQPWALDVPQCNLVLENLPFYTSLFQLMLVRLGRADFSAMRTAHMLFRITKIYCGIENMQSVLYEMEKKLLTDPSDGPSYTWNFGDEPSASTLLDVSSFFPGLPFNGNGSYTEGFQSINHLPTIHFVPSSIKMASVRQMLADLDGSGASYLPLFTKGNRDKVVELVENIGRIIKLSEEPPPPPTVVEVEQSDWWKKVTKVFGFSYGGSTLNRQEYISQMETTKRTQYLSTSRSNLIKLFHLPTEVSSENILRTGPELTLGRVLTDSMETANNSFDADSFYGNGITCVPRGTIPGGFLDMRNGNPDKVEATSNEIKAIVEITLLISDHLNQSIMPWAEPLYFGDSWKSRLCRASLARPEYYYELKKLGPGRSVREKKYLGPRLHLRILASGNLPYALIGYGLLSWFFGLRGISLVLIPFLIVILYLGLRALFEPKHFLGRVRYEFSQQFTQGPSTRNGQDVTGETQEGNEHED